ncbi:MAG: phosphoribosylanthranilate isomerase [Alphaproteobacteria bacterium]
MTGVKICGLSTPETLQTAINAGARFIGLVFYPPSPRNVSFDTAYELARIVPTGVRTIGLFVDPSDEQLDHIVTGIQLDMIQLHGNETPERIAQIKSRHHQPIIKALRISTPADLNNVEEYEAVADWLLFDAKVKGQQGGTGKSFDWNILANRTFTKPWMLSGGLDAGNVQNALSLLNPDAVDISSGVESAKGIKDNTKIKEFIEAVRSHEQP